MALKDWKLVINENNYKIWYSKHIYKNVEVNKNKLIISRRKSSRTYIKKSFNEAFKSALNYVKRDDGKK